jgi:hypothetical protein
VQLRLLQFVKPSKISLVLPTFVANFNTFRAYAKAAFHNCIILVEPTEAHPLALWRKAFLRINIPLRFRSLYGHRSVIRQYMRVGGDKTRFGRVLLRLWDSRCNGPGWGRQRFSVFLCLMIWLLWKLTRGSPCVYSFVLILGVLVYTLFWCYLAYGAFCLARIMVNVFWGLDWESDLGRLPSPWSVYGVGRY